jgi:RNA polymerase primary sigma factor
MNSDSVKRYLKDIRSIPLLTAQEELKLARKARRGDQQARAKLIRSNLRLVLNIARSYSRFGMPLTDLIEEGNLGLIKAISKFNPQRKCRLSTYAAWWIRQYISRAIVNQARIIRVPAYMMDLIMRWQRTTERLKHRLGRRPTLEEMAKEMNVAVKKIRQIITTAKKTSSLEVEIGDDGSLLIDMVEDVASLSAMDELVNLFRREKVEELLQMMNRRSADIIRLRFGLTDGAPRTLSETARHFKISKERVRQIEKEALKKLRKILRGEMKEEDFVILEKAQEDKISRTQRRRRRAIKKKTRRKISRTKKKDRKIKAKAPKKTTKKKAKKGKSKKSTKATMISKKTKSKGVTRVAKTKKSKKRKR